MSRPTKHASNVATGEVEEDEEDQGHESGHGKEMVNPTTTSANTSVALKFSGVPLTGPHLNKLRVDQLATFVGRDLSARGIHIRFPAESCLQDFHRDCSYKMFVSHVSEHEPELFSMGLNVCPFGRESGFLDPMQQHDHIKTCCPKVSSMAAEDAKQLKKSICPYESCPSQHVNLFGLRQHFFKVHGEAAYADRKIVHKDHVCHKGFYDKRSLYQHLIGKHSTGSHLDIMFKDFDIARFIVYTA
jgi:hypothetical protein